MPQCDVCTPHSDGGRCGRAYLKETSIEVDGRTLTGTAWCMPTNRGGKYRDEDGEWRDV